MNVTRTLETIVQRLQTTTVRTIFGEPVSAEGRTIIPVARVAYGFGGGGGLSKKRAGALPDVNGEGAGGGGGVLAVPIGIVEITRDETRFLRFNNWRQLAGAAAAGLALGVVLSRWIVRPAHRE